MNYCPIIYRQCPGENYSKTGLRKISPSLTCLNDFPYNAEQQRQKAIVMAAKMSIQGMQPKLSVKLNTKEQLFEIVSNGGRYIIKPQHAIYKNLPENEGLTMHLAGLCGIETPLSGLIKCADGSWSYFIRRFDRIGHGRKIALEDFAQLAGMTRETKYNFSMERLINIIDQYCTFPSIEKTDLFKRCLFNFIIGNEDMHLKNFSLITRSGKTELAPAYDYLSSTVAFLALGKRIETIEEIALPLQGKKRGITRKSWIQYFGENRLSLPTKVIANTLNELEASIPLWRNCIDISFLPQEQKTLYTELLNTRLAKLGI
ncbi:MAG: HipA domain-containing protein [Kiritimatiellae bacterium]|nr:HipA domain-containing protein [Kiritimatiellia bacterium]